MSAKLARVPLQGAAPGEFHGIVQELLRVCSESFVRIVVTVSPQHEIVTNIIREPNTRNRK